MLYEYFSLYHMERVCNLNTRMTFNNRVSCHLQQGLSKFCVAGDMNVYYVISVSPYAALKGIIYARRKLQSFVYQTNQIS